MSIIFLCGVFIDLKKAFDTFNHKIKPTVVFGELSTITYSLIKQFEGNQLKLDRKDQLNEFLRGTPKGLVLGPLFFLLYANYIYLCSNDLNFSFYLRMTRISFMMTRTSSLSNRRSMLNWAICTTG